MATDHEEYDVDAIDPIETAYRDACDYLEIFANEDGRGLSCELLHESSQPKVSDWRDQELGRPQVTVDKARAELRENLSHEVSCVRKLFEENCGTTSPSLRQITDMFFGEDSKVYEVFRRVPGFDSYNKF